MSANCSSLGTRRRLVLALPAIASAMRELIFDPGYLVDLFSGWSRPWLSGSHRHGFSSLSTASGASSPALGRRLIRGLRTVVEPMGTHDSRALRSVSAGVSIIGLDSVIPDGRGRRSARARTAVPLTAPRSFSSPRFG